MYRLCVVHTGPHPSRKKYLRRCIDDKSEKEKKNMFRIRCCSVKQHEHAKTKSHFSPRSLMSTKDIHIKYSILYHLHYGKIITETQTRKNIVIEI